MHGQQNIKKYIHQHYTTVNLGIVLLKLFRIKLKYKSSIKTLNVRM